MSIVDCEADYIGSVENLRAQFPEESIIGNWMIENSSNSWIDARAKNLSYNIETEAFDKRLISIDDGEGMTKRRFNIMPHIAKRVQRRPDEIGFAHEGFKVIMLDADIRIETKSTIEGNFYGSGKIYYDEDKEKIRFDNNYRKQHLVTYPTGTTFVVFLKYAKEKGETTVQYLKKLHLDYYSAILLGFYGEKNLYINRTKFNTPEFDLESEPKQIEKDITYTTINKDGSKEKKHHKIRFYFYKNKSVLPEELQGITISCFGRKVQKISNFFGSIPSFSDRICVFILADFLTVERLLERDKSGIKKGTAKNEIWRISKQVYDEWIETVTKETEQKKIDIYSINKEKKINKALKKLPELQGLLGKKPINSEKTNEPIERRPCPICKTLKYKTNPDDADYYICERGHTWKKKYRWTKPEIPTGKKPIKRRKRPRSWIGFKRKPMEDILNEAIYTQTEEEEHVIIINKSTETYKYAESKSSVVLDFHINHCIAKLIVEEAEKRGDLVERQSLDYLQKIFLMVV